jgi:hypothetical protein
MSGCVPSNPNIPIPTFDFGTLAPIYADVVLDYSSMTGATSCLGAGGIPVCVQPVMPQTGPCAGNPAIGAPDMSYFTIPASGRIELGFLCSVITAQALSPDGTQQPDFVIYGSFTGGAMPAVEVSMDGSNYVSVNPWSQAMFMGQPAAVFQLAAANLVEARFVRIGEAAGVGSINIDALEALAGLVQ